MRKNEAPERSGCLLENEAREIAVTFLVLGREVFL